MGARFSNNSDLISDTVKRIVSGGFDPRAALWEHKVCVLLNAAQGIIDNGGFEYFFESSFDGEPSMADFALAYVEVGAATSAAAMAEAFKRSKTASPSYDDLNKVLWNESASNYDLLGKFIKLEMFGVDEDDGLDELSAALNVANVKHDLYHDCIFITLPEEQGTVEIKHWRGDTRSVSMTRAKVDVDLVEQPGEFDCPPQEAVDLLRRRLAKFGVVI